LKEEGERKEQHIGYMKKGRFKVKTVQTFIYKHTNDSKNEQIYLKLRENLKDMKLPQIRCQKILVSTIDYLE